MNFKQVKAMSANGQETYYKVNDSGILVEAYVNNTFTPIIYNPSSEPTVFVDGSYVKITLPPTSALTEAFTSQDADIVVNDIIERGLITPLTEYIIGDHHPVGKAVVSIKSRIGEEDYNKLKSLLTFLPRMNLWAWFQETVMPNIQSYGSYEDMVWAAFVEAFNEANLEYISKNNLDPWSWEEQKVETYYLAENKNALLALEERYDGYIELNVNPDATAKALMLEYSELPKIGDIGLEISRQFAIKQLLIRKEYATVKGIIEAFRYASQSPIASAIEQKLPFDIVMGDNTVLKA